MKPVNSCCGQGIFVTNNTFKMQEETMKTYLAQEYLDTPHLINGFKYDMRIYVLISCYDPLRIYIYDDGLARFATEKYNTKAKNLKQNYIHLTNYSVNKYSDKFVKTKENDDEFKVFSKF
jgi:tubulin polyglutamylase TTLL4